MTIYTLGLVYGANRQENYDKSHSNFKSTLEISTNFFSMCKDVWHVNISGYKWGSPPSWRKGYQPRLETKPGFKAIWESWSDLYLVIRVQTNGFDVFWLFKIRRYLESSYRGVESVSAYPHELEPLRQNSPLLISTSTRISSWKCFASMAKGLVALSSSPKFVSPPQSTGLSR